MKPEDLVVGKTYLFLDGAREYLGKVEGFDEPHYIFDRDQETNNFGDRLMLNAWDIRHSVEEIGEKTMPERKPEEISIKLKSSEIVQALSLLGYELKGYRVTHVCGGTDRSTFTLKLEEADEKTTD
ncbi:hypothetical protein UFOVP457_8 [uncultured Caudovirales phage]|uniref:Uncharacterized protein n=1 Tax=uncultured Caudovirales phage TaxID=2100421 RepID=A0A6J5MC36_9CAUD|nr:hypothetical protein UFOVP457_8 [uncultured Caudovirales phage]